MLTNIELVENNIKDKKSDHQLKVADFLSLVKFKVLIANLLPILTGFVLALDFFHQSLMDYWLTSIFICVGAMLVIAGALVMNNWYDADIDSVMERTKKRPTVTGVMPLKAVFILAISLTIIGFTLLFMVNVATIWFAFIGWFTYVFLYTMWSKRRYTFNTLIGSVSGAVTPLIGWASVGSIFHVVPIVLCLLLFIWQMLHTYAIAIKKYQEYLAANVAMLPVVSGINRTKRHMVIYLHCLLPIPFLLSSLGLIFVLVTSILNIGWLILVVSGFLMKDDTTWAHWNFLYSVNYLMIVFLLLIIVTL
ncbi:heme o synthase [Paraliobacillus ryukyuensis]|uniref:heme o synthase n=1 Tax=Paraliobacillus ryukyuensis TaxID=200904 RepID=UPI0009A89041|nr:heme o synthase [Paraliobacillus ryukyuensis]